MVVDVLFPDRDVSDWTTNDGSLVAKLSFGKTSVMLTGDATAQTEKIVLAGSREENLQSTILKVGHHGSHTSSSSDFIKAVSPSYALISSGKDNNYGHPRQVVLDTLSSFGAEIFRTDTLGNIIARSDGENFKFSFQK